MATLLLNTELARPIGIVNGTRVCMNKKPRTHTFGFTDTTVFRADGTSYQIKRNQKSTSQKRTVTRSEPLSREQILAIIREKLGIA